MSREQGSRAAGNVRNVQALCRCVSKSKINRNRPTLKQCQAAKPFGFFRSQLRYRLASSQGYQTWRSSKSDQASFRAVRKAQGHLPKNIRAQACCLSRASERKTHRRICCVTNAKRSATVQCGRGSWLLPLVQPNTQGRLAPDIHLACLSLCGFQSCSSGIFSAGFA